MLLRSRPLTGLVVLGLVALAVSSCGRRGALEAPPDGSAPARPATTRAIPVASVPTAAQEGDELSAAAVPGGGFDTPLTTSRGAKRGYTIPKDPFILDPLL